MSSTSWSLTTTGDKLDPPLLLLLFHLPILLWEIVLLFFPLPQLVRRCILGSILESEKNYLEALKRILEVWRSSCAGGHIYFFFFGLFLITVFHTVCSFSNTRSLSPRLSHGCSATGSWRSRSIACGRFCRATSCSRLRWRAAWLSGTAWRWSGMSLWHR